LSQAYKGMDRWKKNHRRYYQIAGLTVKVESDLPITEATFHPKFKQFEVEGPGEDTIRIRHHFHLPELNAKDMGEEVYRRPPWAIYKKGNHWIYVDISPIEQEMGIFRTVFFNHDHTRAKIYNNKKSEEIFLKGNVHSLALFPTDQVFLARVLGDREGCYLHSSGVIFEENGLLFAGHSEAGKSTIASMLKDKAEILCDDRIIVRRLPDGFRMYGTWSHGDLPLVSSASARPRAILFLHQSNENRIVPIQDRKVILSNLLAYLVRPLVTAAWWEKTLALVERMAREVPCYRLEFDKSGSVVDLLKNLR
jgi:hypothetical protein